MSSPGTASTACSHDGERRLDVGHGAFDRGLALLDDLGRAVASIDVLFNPSVTETWGQVTSEAMAAGVPMANSLSVCRRLWTAAAVRRRVVVRGP